MIDMHTRLDYCVNKVPLVYCLNASNNLSIYLVDKFNRNNYDINQGTGKVSLPLLQV